MFPLWLWVLPDSMKEKNLRGMATHSVQATPDARLVDPGLTANDLQTLKEKTPENIRENRLLMQVKPVRQ